MATAMGDDPNTEPASGSGADGGATATSTPAPPPPRRSGFFDWIRGLGLVRVPGWIGGVCAGIAARLGIDPLIVRGIVVVVAVLGGPVVLLYAAAWLLLPDENDLIHAEEVGRGRFSPAIAGIGVLALLSLLSLSSDSWFIGPFYGDVGDVRGVVGEVVGRLVWIGILITAIVLFVIWVSRRSNASASAPGPYPPAAAPPGDGPAAASAAFSASAAAPSAFAPEPPRPAAAASTEELAAWRQQQEEWKRQRAAWAAEQKRTDRELAAQVARENSRRNAEAAIERARIRRLTNPRISGAYVLLTIGLAIVAGALAALLWPTGGGYDATVGWAAAVFVLGAAIAVAGALRRRSGFLTFLSIVSLLFLLATTALPSGRQFIWPGAYHNVANMMSGAYVQPAGTIELTVWEDNSDEVPEIDILQGRGSVNVFVEAGQTVEVVANTDGRDVRLLEAPGGEEATVSYRDAEDGRLQSTTVAGAEGSPDAVVTLWQGRGTVTVTELP